ncbi:5197_t:CDS:2 [Acaulospora colombiana]|uniref:5197_t:CDS:1 n=1 Tax=Acaulospora colombiana TaxID=27376 RepID=A0ACA9PED0_9GLOM|nr:5197_t:CDS:2 [Acaulospora colombiana]
MKISRPIVDYHVTRTMFGQLSEALDDRNQHPKDRNVHIWLTRRRGASRGTSRYLGSAKPNVAE